MGKSTVSALRDRIINGIIELEGEYVDNPDDSGGPTRWGITEREARANGYTGSMQELPRSLAFDIYKARYWDALNLDIIEKLSASIAEELADTGVNTGIHRAGTFLQRALNVLNQKATQYPDLVVDGQPGEKTMKALKRYLFLRGREGQVVLLRMLNSLQGAFYIELAERREKDETFIYGWFNKRVQ